MSFTMMAIWAAVLLIQNASFTMVSRARNSGSLSYHAVASVFSNGVWFASQFFVISSIIDVVKAADLLLGAGYAVFYTVFTVIGSLSAHYVLMHHVETGKRKVGA